MAFPTSLEDLIKASYVVFAFFSALFIGALKGSFFLLPFFIFYTSW
jgi:hypothetical protein